MSQIITYVKHCAECNAITEVVDTRSKRNGLIVRKRVCPKCNYFFHTVEIEECMFDITGLLDENERLKKHVEELKKGLSNIKKEAEKWYR